MSHPTYTPTDGSVLRAERDAAGVSQDEVAAQYAPATTRQRLSRLERDGRQVSYVDATEYRAAVAAAVAARIEAVA